MSEFEFGWNENKRISTIQKHKIDFNDAGQLFRNPHLDDVDWEHSEFEERRRAIGMINGRVVVLIYRDGKHKKFIVTARKATKDEIMLYYETFMFDSGDW
jgi:hypothetical protein